MFGGMFSTKTTEEPSAGEPSQVASTNTASQSHSNFFATLFEPKKQPPPAPAVQGAVLAGLDAYPEPRRAEPPKAEAQRVEPQKHEPQIAQAPKSKAKAPAISQQDASATASSTGSTGLMRGAQPVVPAGSFDSRWAGLQ
jgi:hypothetical protein